MSSAKVHRFPIDRLRRGWRIVELAPGEWVGRLYERPRGYIARTEVGALYLVEGAIASVTVGLPIYFSGRRG